MEPPKSCLFSLNNLEAHDEIDAEFLLDKDFFLQTILGENSQLTAHLADIYYIRTIYQIRNLRLNKSPYCGPLGLSERESLDKLNAVVSSNPDQHKRVGTTTVLQRTTFLHFLLLHFYISTFIASTETCHTLQYISILSI